MKKMFFIMIFFGIIILYIQSYNPNKIVYKDLTLSIPNDLKLIAILEPNNGIFYKGKIIIPKFYFEYLGHNIEKLDFQINNIQATSYLFKTDNNIDVIISFIESPEYEKIFAEKFQKMFQSKNENIFQIGGLPFNALQTIKGNGIMSEFHIDPFIITVVYNISKDFDFSEKSKDSLFNIGRIILEDIKNYYFRRTQK